MSLYKVLVSCKRGKWTILYSGEIRRCLTEWSKWTWPMRNRWGGHSITCAAFQSRHNLNLVIIKGNTRQTQCEGRRGKDCIYQCHQRQRNLWKCFRLKETSKETWPLNETSHSGLDPLLEGKIAIKGIIRHWQNLNRNGKLKHRISANKHTYTCMSTYNDKGGARRVGWREPW